MSDAASPVQPPGAPGDAAAAGSLTPEAIDRILSDFRSWLTDLAAAPAPADDPPAVDLQTLVAQFTALRHEVNLQTKAARSSLEQTGQALERLGEAVESLEDQSAPDDELKPLFKAVVDVYDNLAIALRQATRQREALEKPLAELAVEPRAPRTRRWRLFRSTPEDDHGQRAADAAKLIRASLDGLIAGYKMSLSRVDRVLGEFELETIPVDGRPFDPELMEAVEVAGETGRPAGEVIEEIRRGYLWRGEWFRFAQVKVAREQSGRSRLPDEALPRGRSEVPPVRRDLPRPDRLTELPGNARPFQDGLEWQTSSSASISAPPTAKSRSLRTAYRACFPAKTAIQSSLLSLDSLMTAGFS